MPLDTSDGGLFQYSYSIIKGVLYIKWYQKSTVFLSLITFCHFTFWEACEKPKKCSVS